MNSASFSMCSRPKVSSHASDCHCLREQHIRFFSSNESCLCLYRYKEPSNIEDVSAQRDGRLQIYSSCFPNNSPFKSTTHPNSKRKILTKHHPTMSVLSVHLSPEHGFSKTSQPSIKLLKGLGVEGDCHLGATTQHLWRLKSHASEPNLRQVHLISSELLDEPEFHGDDGVRVQPGEMGENISTVGIDLLSLGNGTRLHFVDKKYTQTAFDGRYYRVLKSLSIDYLKHLVFRPLTATVVMTMGYSFTWYGIAGGIADCLTMSFVASNIGFLSILVIKIIFNASGTPSNIRSIVMGIAVCVSLIRFLRYWCSAEEHFGEHAIITVSGVRHPCKKVDKFRSGLKEKCLVRGSEDHKIIKRKAGIMAVVTRAGTVEPGMTIIAETTWKFKELPVLA